VVFSPLDGDLAPFVVLWMDIPHSTGGGPARVLHGRICSLRDDVEFRLENVRGLSRCNQAG